MTPSQSRTTKRAKRKRPSQSRGIRKATEHPRRGDAQKAAIIALLLEGCGATEIERRMGVPESTVRNYKRELTADQLASINEKRAGRLDEILWDHLESNFAAMKAITTHVQSEEYIQRQDPDALAVFFGVTHDKSVRILDAIERASGRGGGDTGGSEPDPAGETT